MGSTRFPCKVVADLCGKPMISHVLERAATIRGVDMVALAVPEGDLSQLGHLWSRVYGGPEKDVLARYAGAAKCYQADVIMRITGDCPLIAPDLAERALLAYHASMREHGYLALCQPYCKVADGWDVEIFSRAILEEAQLKATASQREHVVTWMRDSGIMAIIPFVPDCTQMKLSVDTHEDLQRVRRVMEFLNDTSDYSHVATWEAWQRAGRP